MNQLTDRREKILNALIQEYIKTAKPVSSEFLEKKCRLGICPATIRIELQKLTEVNYIYQPHTSAGRVPTNKAYRYFASTVIEQKNKIFFDFISREIETAKEQIQEELNLIRDFTKSLEDVFSTLDFPGDPQGPPEEDNLFEILAKIGPSKMICDKNTDLINSLIKELENLENPKQ